ncbi:glycerate kinase, partial [Desertihabitans aurantiacus]|uniref:glycerate kinase n=1 Tax=Desertihabitans aurantiacus TaxID=2282477 RepID=UPI0013008B89
LRALGARLLDADGADVPLGGAALGRAATLDLSGLDPRLASTRISIACDVDNPLTGPEGAAAVFGPQKGADPATVRLLDDALTRWAELLRATTGVDVVVPGSGAAGGFPAAFLATTPTRLVNGFDLVAELVGLTDAVAGADLVLTGEGSLDAQSLRGKGPIGVAELARAHGIDALALAGVVSAGAEELAARGVVGSAALVEVAPTREAALTEAARWLEEAAARLLTAHTR